MAKYKKRRIILSLEAFARKFGDGHSKKKALGTIKWWAESRSGTEYLDEKILASELDKINPTILNLLITACLEEGYESF